MTNECSCGRSAPDAFLCDRCRRTLDVAIANIAAYYADLDTLRARRAAVRYDTPRGTGGSKSIPLPLDGRFVDGRHHTDGPASAIVGEVSLGTRVADNARNTIDGWTRIVLDTWPPLRAITCADPLCRRCQPLAAAAQTRRAPASRASVDGGGHVLVFASCCRYLHRMADLIATAAPWAPELLDELLHTERELRRLVDVPPDRWYAGPCTVGQDNLAFAALCGADLYAVVGRDTVTCRECEAAYDVATRRDWLLDAAEDRWETASVIAHAARTLGGLEDDEAKLEARIRQWRARGRLEVRDTVEVRGKMRPRFRVGDALDLVFADAQKAGSKTHERSA